jgi:hypothetical protein
VTLETDEYNVIWEVVNRKSADVLVCNTRYEGAGVRKLLKVAESLPHFCRESLGYLAVALSVPRNGFTQFAARALAEPNRLQRDNTSR